MNIPLVSVLITVYNDEKNIGPAIESILQQTFPNFEMVIVNDGSTDKTNEIILNYAAKDARIRVLTQANAGTTVAANNGLQACKGKYVARLDSDDYSYPDRLQTEVDLLEENPDMLLIGGGCHVMDMDGNIIGTRNIKTRKPDLLLQKRCIYQQSDVMFRRDRVIELGGYRNKFKNAQDYDLWLRLSEKGKIYKSDQLFGVWRLNTGGYTFSRMKEQKAEVETIKRMAFLRRKGLSDGYEAYEGLGKVYAHRHQISEQQYAVLKLQFLLKDLQKKQVRAIIKNELKDCKTVTKYIYLILSYFPNFILVFFIWCREFKLNNG